MKIVPLVEEAAKLLGDSEAAQFLRELTGQEKRGHCLCSVYARVSRIGE